jgi:hypothetical protein
MPQVEADVRKEAIEHATATCGQTGYQGEIEALR